MYLTLHNNGTFPIDYIPTLGYEPSDYVLQIDKNTEYCNLWLCAGGSEYDRLRPLSYPDSDVFVVCFDLSNAKSFQSISTHWIPEVMYHCPYARVVLVGLKSDLPHAVSKQQVVQVAKHYSCSTYIEVSAMQDKNVRLVAEVCCRLLYHPRAVLNSKSKPCALQ